VACALQPLLAVEAIFALDPCFALAGVCVFFENMLSYLDAEPGVAPPEWGRPVVLSCV